MENMENQHNVVGPNSINDDIFIDRKGPEADPKVMIAAPAEIRVLGKQPELVCDVVYDAVGDIAASGGLRSAALR